jgi:2-dehydropantoate 2-reductase
MDAIAPAVEGGAAVLPLLNGMRHLDVLDERFGRERILGGWCAIAAKLESDGSIRQLTQAQTLRFGERDRSRTVRIDEIQQLMQGSQFESGVAENIVQEMWEKWVFLSTLAGITCLMRASIGAIMESPGGESLILQCVGEAQHVAAAHGFAVQSEADFRMRKTLTERGSRFTASMLRDIESGGRTEGDHVLGDLLARAQEKQIDTPVLRTAYCHVKAYEIRRAKTAQA